MLSRFESTSIYFFCLTATDILNIKSLSTQIGSVIDLPKTRTRRSEAFIDSALTVVFMHINVLTIKDKSAKTERYSGASESVDFTPWCLFTSLAHVPRLLSQLVARDLFY